MQILHHLYKSPYILHSPCILRISSIHSRSLSCERTGSASRSRRSAAVRPGSAGAPGAEQQPRFVMALGMLRRRCGARCAKAMGLLRRRCGPRCVWVVSSLLFIHIFDGPGPEKRPQIGRFVYGYIDFEKRYTAFRAIMCIVLRTCTGHTQNRTFVSSCTAS